MSDPSEDFYVNPIVGFRTWGIDKQQLMLKALTWRNHWPILEPMISTHENLFPRKFSRNDISRCKPGQPCGQCGLWAFHSYEGVINHQRFISWMLQPRRVRGLVAGWGHVRLCEKGWLAGKAYPLALFEWETLPHLVPDGINWHYTMYRVAKRYRVPVISTERELVEVIEKAGAVTADGYLA